MARAKEELPLIKEAIAELEFTASEMTPASMDRNSQVSLAMRCRTSVMIKADEALQATSTFTARNIIAHFWLNLCSRIAAATAQLAFRRIRRGAPSAAALHPFLSFQKIKEVE